MKVKSSATASILLENRKKLKNSSHPVKLRITFNRLTKYYTLKNKGKTISLTAGDYEKVIGEKARGEFKNLKIFLSALEKRALDVIEGLAYFSFEAFERKYFGASGDEQDLFYCLSNTATKLKAEGRISTASSYGCVEKSIKDFTQKKSLPFNDIDVDFLNEYEKWMLQKENSPTTVGIYLRNVKTMYNVALRAGIVKPEQYPFGKDKYQIPSGRNIKKALTHKDVGLIANYPIIDGTPEHRYRDYWYFSFLCNGINVKDMARLKFANIDEDVITLVRAKTQRETKQKQRNITIVITKEMGHILDRWSNKPGRPDKYVFPILEAGLSPQQEYGRIQGATKLINKYVSRVAESAGITQKVTTYTARHSFATVMKRSGATLEYISESLGHSNLMTTENYLSDFEIDEKRKWAKKLTEF